MVLSPEFGTISNPKYQESSLIDVALLASSSREPSRLFLKSLSLTKDSIQFKNGMEENLMQFYSQQVIEAD